MLTHNLIRRCARKHPQLLDSKGLLHPCQRDASVILNAGRSRVSFILPFVSYMLFLLEEGDLFNRGSWGGCSRHLSVEGSWSDGDPFLHYAHSSGPKIGKALVFLGPHSCVHTLVEFRRHPYKRRTLVK